MSTRNGEDSATTSQRLDDLAQIIATYNQVTQNLRHSHESLKAEVRRLQDELASTDAQLQRSRRLAALGEMAAGIAHEIRNPLAAIGLYAEIIVDDLKQADVPDHVRGTAAKINAAVKGLDAIVNDVLTFSREIRPRTSPVAVSDSFDRSLELLDGTVRELGVEVERRDQVDQPLLLEADPSLLQQALVNLMRNALDAMAEQDQPRRLTLDARVDPDHERQGVLTIADNGPGIDDEAIDRIFNPFFTTRNTGTGLGLAIVHRIVDAHGGAITVHNDGGAVFEIRLPVAAAVAVGQDAGVC